MISFLPQTKPRDLYPDSDGKPMGETPRHFKMMLSVVFMMEQWLREDSMSYVGGNMFIYYMKGKPRKHVSPDAFAFRSMPKITTPERRRILLWEEPAPGPDIVIELTWESIRRHHS